MEVSIQVEHQLFTVPCGVFLIKVFLKMGCGKKTNQILLPIILSWLQKVEENWTQTSQIITGILLEVLSLASKFCFRCLFSGLVSPVY